MAAKLTFEAKMAGMEQVLDLLKRAEERMNDFGRVGGYAIEGVDKRLKEFEISLETINKSQSGLGGLFNKFDEANRKSGEFLGKSYRGIIDGMKQEVKAFEQEADRVVNKIKESESALESFKSRRTAMSEQDYQKGEAQHTRELESHKAQQAAILSSKAQLEREIFYKQPVNAGVYDYAAKYGLEKHATVGGAIQLGIGAMGVPMAAASGMNAFGNYGVQQFYTKQAEAFNAQARLARGTAAQAMAGDPTTYMISNLGGGIENPAMNSWSMASKIQGRTLMDNPWVAGLAGLAIGAGAGFKFGGAYGALAGGAYGAYQGFTGAGNRSEEQIRAEERAALRRVDKETYENLYGPAARGLIREGNELEGYQRTYGIRGAHNIEMQYAYAGVSADRANPFLGQMQAQGLRATAFGFGDQTNAIKQMYRASMSDPVRAAILRGVALNGGTLSGGVMNTLGLDAAAGLTAAGDISARGMLNEYAAGLASQRGFGSNALGTAGAPVAANIAQNAAGFNKVEGVQQGISNYEAQTKLLTGGSSAMATIMIQKLRGLGVTNAIAIDAFIKLDPRLASTQTKIAAYTNKSPKQVAEAITGAFSTYNSMYSDVIGKSEIEYFKKTTGVDLQTLQQSGVRAGENTAGGGGTFGQGLEATGTPVTGEGSRVSTGAQSLTDKTDAASAAIQATLDATMREILAGTGKEVTREITKSILEGFLQTAKEVQKTGDKFIQQRENNGAAPSNAEPFNGVKKQIPKGQ